MSAALLASRPTQFSFIRFYGKRRKGDGGLSALDKLNTLGDKLVGEIIQGGHDLINDMATKASAERKGAVAQVGSEFDYAIDELNDHTRHFCQPNGRRRNTDQRIRSSDISRLRRHNAWRTSSSGSTISTTAFADGYCRRDQHLHPAI